MTELALSGLVTSQPGVSTNPPRQPRTDQARTESAEKREPPRDVERVLVGEVLPASENTYSHLKNTQSRFAEANGGAAMASGQSRRFSLQSAVQTFRDNEAIVTDQNRAVQVSGIIDEYV
jgi:hypothetical protein